MNQLKLSAILLLGLISVLVYITLSTNYYWGRYYGFDPFVQIACPNYDSVFAQIDSSDLVILCLGGSTTNDSRLAPDEKYPAVLDSLFSTNHPELNITVLNGGMDWYTSKHSLINYATYYNKFNPDIVIVMHAINDLCRSFVPVEFAFGHYKGSYAHYYGPAINAAKPPPLEFHYLRKLLGDYSYQKYRFNLESAAYDLVDFQSLNAYSQYMNELMSLIMRDGRLAVFVEQPSLFRGAYSDSIEAMLWFGRSLCNNGDTYPDGASMFEAMNAFNSEVETLCTDNNVLFVRTKNAVSSSAVYFKDDVHHTPIGARILAREVYSSISLQLDSSFDGLSKQYPPVQGGDSEFGISK